MVLLVRSSLLIAICSCLALLGAVVMDVVFVVVIFSLFLLLPPLLGMLWVIIVVIAASVAATGSVTVIGAVAAGAVAVAGAIASSPRCFAQRAFRRSRSISPVCSASCGQPFPPSLIIRRANGSPSSVPRCSRNGNADIHLKLLVSPTLESIKVFLFH